MSDARPTPQRWQNGFRKLRAEADAIGGDLSRDAFNRPPAPGAWSVGQCFDHLNEAGGLLVPRLKMALPELPRVHARRPRLGLLDRFFAWLNGPRGWIKIPAPGAYHPSAAPLDPAPTIRAFQTLQDDLAACAEAAEELDWSSARLASPASRFVRLSVGGWLAATLAHERRHLQQARAASKGVR